MEIISENNNQQHNNIYNYNKNKLNYLQNDIQHQSNEYDIYDIKSLQDKIKPKKQIYLDNRSQALAFNKFNTYQNLLAVADEYGQLYIYNINSYENESPNDFLKFKQRIHYNSILDIDWVDNNKIITGSGDNTAKLIDIEKEKEIVCFKGHNFSIKSAKSAKNKPHIQVTCGRDGKCCIWDDKINNGLVNVIKKDQTNIDQSTSQSSTNSIRSLATSISNTNINNNIKQPRNILNYQDFSIHALNMTISNKKRIRNSLQTTISNTNGSLTGGHLQDIYGSYSLLALSEANASILYFFDIRKFETISQKSNKVRKDTINKQLFLGIACPNNHDIIGGNSCLDLSSSGNFQITNNIGLKGNKSSLNLQEIQNLDIIQDNYKNNSYNNFQQYGHNISLWNKCKMSPNEKYIASGSSDRKMYIWQYNKNKYNNSPIAGVEQHNGEINDISWSAINQQQIASCSDDKTVIIWDQI